MADGEKREYQLGISRCFDYDGNLKEQWVRASADTMEELEVAYQILTQGVLAWPITLGTVELSAEPPETPPEAAEGQSEAQPQENIRPAPKRTQRPTGPPSDKQCNTILAICHSLDSKAVDNFFGNDPIIELYVNENGELLPTWASMQALGSFKASKVIEALHKIEAM